MRTTVTIDDELLKEARKAAMDAGKTLNRLVEDAVREALARRKAHIHGEPVVLPVSRGGRVRPGVDLYDSASLLDLLDRTDAAS